MQGTANVHNDGVGITNISMCNPPLYMSIASCWTHQYPTDNTQADCRSKHKDQAWMSL